MAQHAKLSPSSAKKWMTCPGSVAMEDGSSDSSSEYADEGTSAHFLASECLSNNAHPATYLGRVIEVGYDAKTDFDGAVWADSLPSMALRHEFEVDTDMVAAVNTYVQNIRGAIGTGELLVEQKLSLDWLTGEEDANGTGDVILLKPDERLLEVHDLKYGQGVVVSPENNEQLMVYGLAALEQYSILGDFDNVKLVIHQPRVYHRPTEWVVSVAQLREFEAKVRTAAKDALIAYEFRANWLPKTLSENVGYLTPSTDGCQWCKAKAKCPALAQQVIAAVADDFVDLDADIAPQLDGCLERTMDGSTLANMLKAVDLIELWCKAVRTKSYSELMAGASVPGYKLVQGKKGARKWGNAENAETLLKMMKLKIEEMYDMTLISPTSAEKIFGEKGRAPSPKRWNKLLPLITQSEGSTSVAPETDPRPAFVVNRAAEFVDATGEDLG